MKYRQILCVYLCPSPALFMEIACWLISCRTDSFCVCVCVCFPREGAASGAGPEADNMGGSAERELPGQTGAPALGEQ